MKAYEFPASVTSEGKIELPEGFDPSQIAHDLKEFILKDFRNANIIKDTDNNLAHRAFYAHCTKRAIDSIRQGEYRGEDGYLRRYPEIADILEKRVNEILFEKLVKNNVI